MMSRVFSVWQRVLYNFGLTLKDLIYEVIAWGHHETLSRKFEMSKISISPLKLRVFELYF